MPSAQLDVQLLAYTPSALALVFAAMRQCYSDGYAANLFEDAQRSLMTEETTKGIRDFIGRVLASGHESPVEHVSFTFAVSGVSRALSHQLVRHRIASYSQQSQRYVDANGFMYIIPPHIACVPEARDLFIKTMNDLSSTYGVLQDILIKNGHKATANEDARFVLPNACETRILFTMNTRTLWNFFGLRCCTRAQWEIRAMANMMLDQCRVVCPVLFAHAGAKCDRTGYCTEGERTCGKRPLMPLPVKPMTDEDVAEAGKDWP